MLFHDAVRPLVTARIISECFDGAGAATPPSTSRSRRPTRSSRSATDDTIREIPPRAALRRGQTPQAFRASVIRAAYATPAADPDFVATDDCTVVLRYLPEEPIWWSTATSGT